MLTLPDPQVDPTDAVDPIDDERRDLVDEVTGQLFRLKTLMQRVGHALATEHSEVDHGTFRLLAKVVFGGPARTTALAEALGSDTSTVSRQVSGLVKAGLVERRPDAADGRACLLAATERGQRAFAGAHRARTLRLSRLLDGWDADDLRALVATLDRFSTDVEQYPPLFADKHRPGSAGTAGTVGPRGENDTCGPVHGSGSQQHAEGETVR